MKYLNDKINQGIQSNGNEKQNLLEAYCDVDFAGDLATRRNTTGYIIFYGGGALSWCSRRQPIIVLSSTEYVAAAECYKNYILKLYWRSCKIKKLK